MKKILLSISLFVSFIAYATAQRLGILGNQPTYTPHVASDQTNGQTVAPSDAASSPGTPTIPAPRRSGGGIFGDDYEYGDEEDGYVPRTTTKTPTPPTSTQVPANKPVSSSMPPPITTNSGLYRNGSYTGTVADAYYGNVQVRAIISGGKISNIQFLDYPQDRSNSIRINTYAMPILTREAITAQNANVDAVSGATATSGAFVESLASALAQAKN